MQIKCCNSWFYRVDIVFWAAMSVPMTDLLLSLMLCYAVQSRLYFYSSHCVLVCTVDKYPPLLWLLFCCCLVAREQMICFLQDRVRDKLLIGRSSGLCNNLLIQKRESRQVQLNKWLVYCNEAKASFTVCLHILTQPALFNKKIYQKEKVLFHVASLLSDCLE